VPKVSSRTVTRASRTGQPDGGCALVPSHIVDSLNSGLMTVSPVLKWRGPPLFLPCAGR
jgi:hypothetical protein